MKNQKETKKTPKVSQARVARVAPIVKTAPAEEMPPSFALPSMPNISFPKLPDMPAISLVNILVTLLLVETFFLGVFYTKVQDLEKVGGGLQAAAAGQAGANGVLGAQTPAPAQQAPTGPAQKVDVANGHLPLLGKDSALVTIVEFEDFRCPFCQRYVTQTEAQIIKDYVDTGKAKIAYRQYPFLGPASIVAADAAECANDQGKFWQYHDYLFKNQPDESDTTMYTTDKLTKIATDMGMNGDAFKACLDNKTDDPKVSADLADGQKAGVNGTPTFFVNGTSLVGAQPYSAFQTAIDAELKK